MMNIAMHKRKRLLFIYNKKSGRGMVRLNLAEIIDVYIKNGYETLIYSTQCAGDACEKVIEYADNIDAVACAGGDGTVNEVITGVMKSGKDIPIFYLPSGSTNDYGASLEIPKNQLSAAESTVNGKFKKVDIGCFNDKYFDYVAAFGLLTDISYATNQDLKNKIGYAAYLLEISKRLINIPVINMTVTIGNKIYSDDWFYGMITNSKQVGGLKNITGPNVLMDDGVFEVTLVRATKNPVEFIEVISALATGTESYFIVREKTSKIKFESREEVSWTLDGESGGSYNNVTIENIKKAVRIAIPRSKKEPNITHAV